MTFSWCSTYWWGMGNIFLRQFTDSVLMCRAFQQHPLAGEKFYAQNQQRFNNRYSKLYAWLFKSWLVSSHFISALGSRPQFHFKLLHVRMCLTYQSDPHTSMQSLLLCILQNINWLRHILRWFTGQSHLSHNTFLNSLGLSSLCTGQGNSLYAKLK